MIAQPIIGCAIGKKVHGAQSALIRPHVERVNMGKVVLPKFWKFWNREETLARSPFGWDLPPGCTQRHIDEAFGGDDYPCECCGRDPADCICPECLVCHEQGNLHCYTDPPAFRKAFEKHGIVRPPNHGLKFTRDQQIGQCKMRIYFLKQEIQDEEQVLAYLEQGGDVG